MTHADPRSLLRHAVATLAYRAAKVLRDFPAPVVDVRVAAATRTPHELLSHLGDLMHWATNLARGDATWRPAPVETWQQAHDRFFRGLQQLDDALAAASPECRPLEQILQGPIADALTHTGQLAMLRGMLGTPVRPESYARAEIHPGHVGPGQPTPRAEFDGDASHPKGERP